MTWVVALGGIVVVVAAVAGVGILVAPARAERAFRRQWASSFAPEEPRGRAPQRSDVVVLALLILVIALGMTVLLVLIRTGTPLWEASMVIGLLAVVLVVVQVRQGARVAADDAERGSRMIFGRMPRWFAHSISPSLVLVTYALLALAGAGLVAISILGLLS